MGHHLEGLSEKEGAEKGLGRKKDSPGNTGRTGRNRFRKGRDETLGRDEIGGKVEKEKKAEKGRGDR